MEGWRRRSSEDIKEGVRRWSEAEGLSMLPKLDQLWEEKQARDTLLAKVEVSMGALEEENKELKEEICRLKEDFESLRERFEAERRARELEKEEIRANEAKRKKSSVRNGALVKSSYDEEDWNKAGQDIEGKNEAPPAKVSPAPAPKKKKETTKNKKTTIRKKKATDVSELLALASLSDGVMFSPLSEGQENKTGVEGSGSGGDNGNGSGDGSHETTFLAQDSIQQALADLNSNTQTSSSTSVTEELFSSDSTPSITIDLPSPGTEEGVSLEREGGKRQKRKKKRELLDHSKNMSLQDYLVSPPKRSQVDEELALRTVRMKAPVMSTGCQDLLNLFDEGNKIKSVIIIQRAVRRMLARRETKHERMSVKIVEELVETEDAYVSKLECCIKNFYEPLLELSKAKHPIITSEEVKTVFSELYVIHLFNQKFLADLSITKATQEGMKWKDRKYGTTVDSIAHILRPYSMYCNNFLRSQALRAKLLEKAKYKGWIEKQNRKVGDDLDSLLIRPIQRQSRYVLLLRTLLKHTPYTHPDFKALKTALKNVEDITIVLDRGTKDAEVFNEVLRINSQLSPSYKDFVQPHRRFVKEGPILYQSSKTKKDPEAKYIILCNDVMLITQPPKQGLFHQHSKIYTLNVVVHLEKAAAVVPLADSDHVRNAFIVDCPKTSLMFYAQSEEEKEEWVNAIANYLQKTKENIGSFSLRERKTKPVSLKHFVFKLEN